MSKVFVILMMVMSLCAIGCSDDPATALGDSGDGGSSVPDVVATDTVEDTSAEASDASEDEPDVTGVEDDDVHSASDAEDQAEEPDSLELSGDPTEDPQGRQSSFYEFAAWEIPSQDQDKEDDR